MGKCTKKINDHEKIPEIEIETHLLSEDQITTRLLLHLYKATLHIKNILLNIKYVYNLPRALQTANGAGSLLPSPRYGKPPNGGVSPRQSNQRPRSLIMQKVDGDYASTQGNPSRRNSEAPTRTNSVIGQYGEQLEQERKNTIDKVNSASQDGSEKLRQAKANLSDDLAYVQAGSRRASKYDLY